MRRQLPLAAAQYTLPTLSAVVAARAVAAEVQVAMVATRGRASGGATTKALAPKKAKVEKKPKAAPKAKAAPAAKSTGGVSVRLSFAVHTLPLLLLVVVSAVVFTSDGAGGKRSCRSRSGCTTCSP